MASRFFLLLFVSIFGSSIALKENEASKFLVATCNKTPEPKVCISALSVFPDSKKASNVHDLAMLSFRAVASWKQRATTTIDDYNMNNATKDNTNCLDNYTSTLRIIPVEAIVYNWTKILKQKSLERVNILVSTITKQISNSDSSCKDKNGKPIVPQIDELFGELTKLLKVQLALAKLDSKF